MEEKEPLAVGLLDVGLGFSIAQVLFSEHGNLAKSCVMLKSLLS